MFAADFAYAGSFAEPSTGAHCRIPNTLPRKQDFSRLFIRTAELGRVGRLTQPAREWELEPPRQTAQT